MKIERKFHPAQLDRIIDQSQGSETRPTLQDLADMAADTIADAGSLSPNAAQRDENVRGAFATLDELLRRRRESD